MSKKIKKLFHNIDDLEAGIYRELTKGISTRIFPGENAMLSIVRIDPNAKGKIHSHEEEQWGFLLTGSVTRLHDGESFDAVAGDFWRTPSGVPHSVIGGSNGAVILDIFSPPRSDYLKEGSGFGEAE